VFGFFTSVQKNANADCMSCKRIFIGMLILKLGGGTAEPFLLAASNIQDIGDLQLASFHAIHVMWIYFNHFLK